MECIFNKEKLHTVLFDFYKSTGIAIALYDANETEVAFSPIYSECCALIRTKSECVKCCERSNEIHMDVVEQSRRISCYSCHAGLMEAILPIIYDGVLIAYLQIGQFRDAEKEYSSEKGLRESAKKYGFDTEALLCAYEKLPIVSREKLQAICNILDILIKSFWEDGLITYKRSMLSVKIEKYISDNLCSNIYISELCEQFRLSKNALYKLFKDELSTTVNEFITKKRLDLARHMLRENTEMNVTEIASRCGFSDYNYFIRAFKKHLGVTPLKYRKNS